MKLYIKNMVSLRCKLTVAAILDQIGIPYSSVELGVVTLRSKPTSKQREQLRMALRSVGLELLENRQAVLVERIRTSMIDLIFNEDLPRVNFSDYISRKLGYSYTYLTNVFSRAKGTTIQHFIIELRIERAKELLQHGELTLTEISYMLRYSSVAHLSNQFKKVTGVCPHDFIAMQRKQDALRPLEEI